MRSYRKLVLSLTLAVLFALTNVSFTHAQVTIDQPVTVSTMKVGTQTGGTPFRAGGAAVGDVALNHHGAWSVIIGSNGYSTDNLPNSLLNSLAEAHDDGDVIEWIAISDDGAWVLSTSSRVTRNGVPSSMDAAISELMDSGNYPTYAAFTTNGGWVVGFGRNGYRSQGLPGQALDTIKDLNDRNKAIYGITFGSSNSFVVWYDTGMTWAGIPQTLIDELTELHDAGTEINDIALYQNTGWVVVYGGGYTVGKAIPSDFVDALIEAEG